MPALGRYLTPTLPVWFGAIGLAIALLAYWLNLVELAARVLRPARSTLLVAALVPLLWIVVGGVALFGVPAITFYVALMLYTLV